MQFTRLGAEAVDYALLVSVALALIYLLGPQIREVLRREEDIARSFGGGVAAAYVFLQLFPEIEATHRWLGESVHIVTLVSFLIFFGIEQRLRSHSSSGSGARSARAFWVHVALSWLYIWVIVFALPPEIAENFGFALIASIAIGLHALYKDYVLRTHHTSDFESAGRYILALAPLAGMLARLITTPSEAVFDLFVAALSGFLLQSVFQSELAGYERFIYRWFVVAALLYTVLVTIAR